MPSLRRTAGWFALVVVCAFQASAGSYGAEPTAPEAPPRAAAATKELSTVKGVSLRRSAGADGQPRLPQTSKGRTTARWFAVRLDEPLRDLAAEEPLLADNLCFGEGRLPQGLYNLKLDLAVPKDGPSAFRVVADAYEKAFGVKVSLERRKVEGFYVRVAGESGEIGLPPAAPPHPLWGDFEYEQRLGFGLRARREAVCVGKMDRFAKLLQQILDRPVVDQTQSDGRFRSRIVYAPRTALDDVKSFLKAHGLELAPFEADVAALFIDPTPPNAKPGP